MTPTPWHTGRLAGFDIESTGVDVETARIVTAAVIGCGGDQPTDPMTWLVNPGIDIPDEAAAIHGITTEKAQAVGLPAEYAVDQIATLLASYQEDGTPIVAFNARYDYTVLDRECRRYGLKTVAERCGRVGPVIDPYVIDKQLDRWRKGSRKLDAVCSHYGVALGDDAHEATADALACTRVAYKQAARNRQLQVSLPQLMAMQTAWAEEQAASLQEYFRRKDPTAVVEGAWPLVPHRPDGP